MLCAPSESDDDVLAEDGVLSTRRVSPRKRMSSETLKLSCKAVFPLKRPQCKRDTEDYTLKDGLLKRGEISQKPKSNSDTP